MPAVVDHGAPHEAAQADNDVVVRAVPDGPLPDRSGRLKLSECHSPESVFTELVRDAALKSDADPRALGVRVLLHLPRVATSSGWVTRTQVARELVHSAWRLRDDVQAVRDLVPAGKFSLPELSFGPVEAVQAETIFSRLHYLRSARPGSLNFALLDPVDRLPVSLCSVSPLEWKRVGALTQAQFGIPPEKTWDVSRVYSCPAAPPNAISFLLARVRSSLRRSGFGIELLITVVDPNLGFTGASYRAANWQRWLTVQARPYLYHERRYITPRQLRHRFGTSKLAELRAQYPGQRFEQSRSRLLDSLIFCCRISGETEAVPAESQRRLHR